MTPTKLLLYAKGKKIDRQNRDSEMYNWFLVYAIPAISCGIGAAFSKDTHIEYPKQAILSEKTEESEEDTYDKELQRMLLNEQKWAARAEKRGLPPTIL
jgi:hypothetical protein|nr:MAG TPA: hypothetical protein [Bacteriophage sp.]